LNRPHGVTVHRDGTLYITDSYNNRVLKIVR
jgi:glucose/arabinose dehydrogenase